MPGLLRGVARTAVVAGTATAVSNRVSRRQAGRWAEQEYAQQEYAQRQAAQQQYERAPAPAAPAASAASAASAAPMADSGDVRIARLRQLAELKAQGILTDAEFEAEKSRILAS